MNDLVIMKSRKALTTSLKVAATFSKEHKNVLQSIRNLTAENSAVKKMFAESTYVNDRGQEQPMYYMNRDGFTLLAMGFTGRDAMKFKLECIETGWTTPVVPTIDKALEDILVYNADFDPRHLTKVKPNEVYMIFSRK